jgi:hypothetical protein
MMYDYSITVEYSDLLIKYYSVLFVVAGIV